MWFLARNHSFDASYFSLFYLLSPDFLFITRSLFQLAFLTPCDQAFNPPFLGGKIIELAKFCFKNKRFEPSLSFLSKQVIVSHCV